MVPGVVTLKYNPRYADDRRVDLLDLGDHRTLLVFLCSGSDAVSPYEEDLLAEIHRGERGAFRLAVGGRSRGRLVAPVV